MRRDRQTKPGLSASTDRIDTRSFPEDLRERAAMQPRPTPLFSHKIPEAAAYEKVSTWTEKNRAKAKKLAESHGNRVPAGGWPKLTGTGENRQKQAIREIDSVLLHPQIQIRFGKDRMTNEEIIKYRAPEAHQAGGTGVVNTGRGAVYSKNGGLIHLLSNKRDDDVFAAAQAKVKDQNRARVARKSAQNAS